MVVPDYQLSLAIGKEGQNARLAARLTGFKIDIKSETQAKEIEGWLDVDDEYEEYEDFEDYQARAVYEEEDALSYEEDYDSGQDFAEEFSEEQRQEVID